METRKGIHLEGKVRRSPIPIAARVGPLLISSLIRGSDNETREMPDDPGKQAEFLMGNIRRMMEAAGGTMEQIVKIGIYIQDRSVIDSLDAAWIATFPDEENRPARQVFEQKLGRRNAYFEAEVEAYLG